MRKRSLDKDLLFALLTLIVTAAFCGVATVETQATSTEIASKTITIDSFRSDSPSGFSIQSNVAQDVFSIPDGQQSASFESDLYSPDFELNSIGVTWNGVMQQEQDVEMKVHINTPDSTMTRVLPHLSDDIKEPLPANTHATNPIIVTDVSSFSLEVNLHRSADGSSPTIESLELVYFDTTQDVQLRQTTNRSITGGSSSQLDIVTRTQWGADESLRFNSKGNAIWPAEYVDPEIFILHHTAGTDGGDDPAATIRSIYYWHAVVLGWGDIGYNYLIDPTGTIYKGRKGKDGVIGGHTFNESESIDLNVGSVGIAFLGCFEEADGACYSQYDVTPEMKSALTSLVGTKAAEFDFDPKESTTFQGFSTKRLAGHKDVDSTFCPGSSLYSNMGKLRKKAQKKYRKITAHPWEGSMKSLEISGERSDSLEVGQTYSVTVSYENTGQYTWRQGKTRLKVYNGTGKKRTPLRHSSWKDVFGKIPLDQETVAPGETGTFTFSISNSNSAGTKNIVTKLFHGKSKVRSSNATHELTFNQPFAGSLVDHTIPVAMYHNDSLEVTVTFENTGETTWNEAVKLRVNGKKKGAVPQPITSGDTVSFTFDIQTPSEDAEQPYVHYFVVQLKKHGGRIPGTRRVFAMEIH